MEEKSESTSLICSKIVKCHEYFVRQVSHQPNQLTTCVESRFPPGSLESVVAELVLYLHLGNGFLMLVYTGMSQRPNELLVSNLTITHL